jgi:hypothetical protein
LVAGGSIGSNHYDLISIIDMWGRGGWRLDRPFNINGLPSDMQDWRLFLLDGRLS